MAQQPETQTEKKAPRQRSYLTVKIMKEKGIIEPEGLRFCSNHKTYRPIAEFSINVKGGELSHMCNSCKARAKMYAEQRKEQRHEHARAYYLEHADKLKAATKAYEQSHKRTNTKALIERLTPEVASCKDPETRRMMLITLIGRAILQRAAVEPQEQGQTA